MTTAGEHGNVTLLVSNQSFELNPVDIEISIDGEAVVRDTFDVEGDQPPQHNWSRYLLQLEDGRHRLAARAGEQAELDTEFDVAGKHTIAVAHWYSSRTAGAPPKGYFTFESQARPIATM